MIDTNKLLEQFLGGGVGDRESKALVFGLLHQPVDINTLVGSVPFRVM